MTRRYVLMVSGGPDSMYLLAKYHKQAIVVLHVNYAKRESALRDEMIVREACKKWNVPLQVENFTPPLKSNNFQAEAREFRLEAAKKLALSLGAYAVLTAHHKDDFLETAWWQLETKREPRQYGIAKKTVIDEVNFHHPLLTMWKSEILKYLKIKNIAFGIDETNELPIYRRNVIRQEIAKLDLKTKNEKYDWFVAVNKIRKLKYMQVTKAAKKWKDAGYTLAAWSKIKNYQEEVLFVTLHECVPNLALSSDKLKSVVDFLHANTTSKTYTLNDKALISKRDKRMQIELIN